MTDSTNIQSFRTGQVVSTNKEHYPYFHVWLQNEDGSYTNHLFTVNEMERSNTRALNSPHICFELIN